MNCQKTSSFHGLIPDQNGQSVYPLPDQNAAKTLPDGAAHTYIAYTREYPPWGGGGGGDTGFSLLFYLNSYRAFFCLKVKCFLPCKMHHCSLLKRNCCLEIPRVCSQRKGACVFFRRPSNSKERDSNQKWIAISYVHPV